MPGLTRIVVAGCVKTKRKPRQPFVPAGTLYASPLWAKRKRYAEQSGCPWAILSAELGLVCPDAAAWYYERHIRNREHRVWARRVYLGLAYFARRIPDYFPSDPLFPPMLLEVHAGKAYVDALQSALDEYSPVTDRVEISHPVKGLQIGELLAWYNTENEHGS